MSLKLNFKLAAQRAKSVQRFLLAALLIFFTEQFASAIDLTVAANGSGQFKSVQQAIMSVPSGSATNPVVIHIKPGVYKELIYVQREKSFFKLIGENPTNTILTFDLFAGMTNVDGKPIGTFKTPSTTIDADDFTAENLTFENSAGPVGQALAIRVDGDRATFRNCHFLGWQDTILLNRGRQYFENCLIAGHVDFIFGAATAWFEKCQINCLSNGYVTAASTPKDQPFGFVFSHCNISGVPGAKTFLGRPWRIYASTIFLNCELSGVVRPDGWFDWKKPEAHQTARYAEFNSSGAGANPSARVPWTKQLSESESKKITVENVLGGADDWNPTLTCDPQFGPNRTNIIYGEADGKKLLLDAHVPDGDGKFPVAILVHGGGWTSGDKDGDIGELFEPLMRANFAWFSINYRLAPTNLWPACFEDMQTAIRWVKTHAAEFKGDTNRIALIGYSAGGQIVCLAATLTNFDTRVQAVVGCAPPTDMIAEVQRRGGLNKWTSMAILLGKNSADAPTLKMLAEISPAKQIHAGMPAIILIQGDADKTVVPEQTIAFASQLKSAGVPCDLILIPKAEHRIAGWLNCDPMYQQKMMDELRNFLNK